MVEFFSAEMVCKVCKYRSCNACGDSWMTSAASFKALAAFISPSAAITYKTFFNIIIITPASTDSPSQKKETETVDSGIRNISRVEIALKMLFH